MDKKDSKAKDSKPKDDDVDKKKINLDSKLDEEDSNDKKSLLDGKEETEETEMQDPDENDFEITKNKELEKIHKKIMSGAEEPKEEPKDETPSSETKKEVHKTPKTLLHDTPKKEEVSFSDIQEIKEFMNDFVEVFRKAAEEIKDDDFQALQRKVEHISEQNNVIASSLAKIANSLNALHVKITPDMGAQSVNPTLDVALPTLGAQAPQAQAPQAQAMPAAPQAPAAPPTEAPPAQAPALPTDPKLPSEPAQAPAQPGAQPAPAANAPMPPPAAAPGKDGTPPKQQPAAGAKKGLFGLKL
jgi:hypothetical protein